MLNVGAILIAVTLYSSIPILLNALLIVPALALYTTPSSITRPKKPASALHTKANSDLSPGQDRLNPFPERPFITMYRGGMMVITCLSILAVDFRAFPRRFAKVENWGTSLMDMGVGSFVFSAGLVSMRPVLKSHYTGRAPSLSARLYSATRHSLPLLVLGFIRLFSVKGLDYAEHITEYGVHWNFFFTLALLPPFVALFQSLSSLIPSYALLSLLVSGIYQAFLELTTLKAYILVAPRTHWLSQNREGVFSFLGYLAVFLGGQAAGQYVLPRDPTVTKLSSSMALQRRHLLVHLCSWAIIWSTLLHFTVSYHHGLALGVSRRLANLPYVLWVLAFNCGQLTAFCAIETFAFPGVHRVSDVSSEKSEITKATSRILKAYNRNGLFLFALANLMTGLVNMTVNTLSTGTGAAMAILLGYASILTSVAITLDAWDISVKL